MQVQLQQAVAMHQQGRLPQAQALYEAILRTQPRQADALHLLGVVALQSGDAQRAADLIASAVEVDPDNPVFLSNQANALRALKRLDAALASVDQAIRLRPGFAEAHCNRGVVLEALGQPAAALASYDQALKLQPGHAEAGSNRRKVMDRMPDMLQRAVALHQQGHLAQAQGLYEDLLRMQPRQTDAMHLLGVIALQRGDAQRAADLIAAAIEINPTNAAFHCNLGNARRELQQFDAALDCLGQAIRLQPNFAEAHSNRGVVLEALGRLDAALASYDLALRLRPDDADGWSNRGNVLKTLGRLKDALASHDRAIALRPDRAQAHVNRGLVLRALHLLEAALASYDEALRLLPTHAEAWFNRGNTLRELKQPKAAVASYDRAVHLRPSHADAYNNRGSALIELDDVDAALASFDMALQLQPDHADACCNRANALRGLQQLDAALASYDRALQIQPEHADAHANRGVTLMDLGRLSDALESFDRAILLRPGQPDAHWNRSLAWLLAGDYDRGWPAYEWRWKLVNSTIRPPRVTSPAWLGNEPLNGRTLFLHSEQGLGDTIQFCRYATVAANQGARVVLEVPDALFELMKGLGGPQQLTTPKDTLPQYDLHCPLLSLPLAFGTRLDTVPGSAGYLRSDNERLETWAARLGPRTRPRIGVAWSGRALHRNDRRSMRLAELLPHLPHDLECFSLQKDLREADQAALQASGVRHFGADLRDFADTAALCNLMDLIISVDTSVAHLGGALGRPTWVLLQHIPDWRWLLDRRDNPWYDSIRLYRQGPDRQWGPVLQRVAQDLEGLATHTSGGPQAPGGAS